MGSPPMVPPQCMHAPLTPGTCYLRIVPIAHVSSRPFGRIGAPSQLAAVPGKVFGARSAA